MESPYLRQQIFAHLFADFAHLAHPLAYVQERAFSLHVVPRSEALWEPGGCEVVAGGCQLHAS